MDDSADIVRVLELLSRSSVLPAPPPLPLTLPLLHTPAGRVSELPSCSSCPVILAPVALDITARACIRIAVSADMYGTQSVRK